MRIPIDNVFWTQAIEAGGLFGKSLAAKPGVQLSYTGSGVLVEQDGKPARLVPMGNVLVMEAKGGFEGPLASGRVLGELSGEVKVTDEQKIAIASAQSEPHPLAEAAALAYNPEASKAQQEAAAATLAKAMAYPDKPAPQPAKKKGKR